MKILRLFSCLAAVALVGVGAAFTSIHSSAADMNKQVTIDGSKANKDTQSMYRGLGMVSANGSSRLLLDYKDENPDKYWEIMNYLFNKDTGMGLSHIKVEMGSDVNSSSGTEPSIKRTEKEIADVTRGAGFQLAKDAKSINPDITLDMLRWGEPLWISEAKNPNAARYKWYKETLDAAYKTYGLKFNYVSANRNEKVVEADWIIYLAKALKAEKAGLYDYSKIKVVAADEVGAEKIADQMLKNKDLMNAVDVISLHYTSWTSDNVKKIGKTYGKEIWFGEGSAPMGYSTGTYRYDGTGSGISGLNGMLDIATRIITMYPGGAMNLYEFQPAVASYYSGSTYFPKQLITANEPWSGHYALDAGFYMAMHFSWFSKVGWQYIDGACEGDGKAGGDGHAIIESKYNYQTISDPDSGDYSIVIANNTANTEKYTFNIKNLAKSASSVDVWETRGPDDDKNYYQNYLKKLATITPQKNTDGTSTYQVEIKPYSLVTISTLKREEKDFASKTQSKVLPLPYADDFEYVGYDKEYLKGRGYAPRYTTDEGGAFEVANIKNNHVLKQKITYDIKPVNWGNTPYPVTNFGDDRWANYSVSADVLLSTKKAVKNKAKYVGVGARYILGTAGNSGYWLQLFENGTYQLNIDNAETVIRKLKGFDKKKWYNLKISVNKNIITCYINNKKVIEYKDKQAFTASGRAALYSDYSTNCFDNVKVEDVKGATSYSKRIDDTESPLSYDGAWTHEIMSSFRNFNRTIATGTKGSSLSFEYTGEGFAIIGPVSSKVKIKVEVDGKVVEDGYMTDKTYEREASYYNYNLDNNTHKVKITVLSGKYSVDAVEVITNNPND